MSRRILALTSLLAALLAAGACGGGGSGEKKADFDAAGELKRSAAAMARVQSVGLRLESTGKPPVSVRAGDLKLLRGGDAQGTLTMRQSGMDVEMKLVASGNAVYLDAGTGGWQKVPRALAALKYDPAAVLDPDRGIVKLLDSARAPKAEATEKVGGKDAYRIAATLPKERVAALVPGIATDLDGTLWIGRADHRLLKVRAGFPGGRDAVLITCTEYDAPYKISAPR